MQLTQFTDLGLRILMYLTQEQRILLVTNTEIAEQFSVPHNHLIKVTHALSKLGWITTVRGRNGGLSLNIDPKTLSISKVLRALEGDKPLIDCAASACTLTGRCQLAHALNHALSIFYKELDTVTLHDVCKRETGAAIIQMHQSFLGSHGLSLKRKA